MRTPFGRLAIVAPLVALVTAIGRPPVGFDLHAAPQPRPQTPAERGDAEDDPEERAERRELSRRAVRENCMICHSDDLIRSQRLTPKQWKAEVEKMVGWGSPLPAELQSPLVEYLSAEYPADAPPAAVEKESLRQLTEANRTVSPLHLPKGDAGRGKMLYDNNCANCHGADAQGAELGPNLVEKPVLLSETAYSEVVRKGRGRMPGFSSLINPAAEADLLTWLQQRRYQPPAAGGK